MKKVQILLPVALVALGLGCGYSKSNMPPTAGAMPVIQQLTPPSTTAGSAAFTLTVTGTSFNANAVVNWNGMPMSGAQHTGTTQLAVMVPAANVAASGTVKITVTNPGTPGGAYGGGTMAETSTPPTDFPIN